MGERMTKEKETGIELAEIVRLLSRLFPAQHPKSTAWLRGLVSEGSAGVSPIGPTVPPRRMPSRSPQHRPTPPTSPRDRARQFAEKARPVNPAPPSLAPPPPFARELSGTVAEWRDQHAGIEITWDREAEIQDRVAAAAGLIDRQNGYVSTMLAVSGDLMVDGHGASVELLIPRVQNADSVIVGVGLKGMPKRYFEVALAKLSPEKTRELTRYALGKVRP